MIRGGGTHSGDGCGCPACMASNNSAGESVSLYKGGGASALSPNSYGAASTPSYVTALNSGSRWNGTPANITYTFSTLSMNQANTGASNFQLVNAEQRAGVLSVFQNFSNVANVQFTQAANPATANIKIVMADLPTGTAGWAYYPNAGGSDLVIDIAYTTGFTPGNFGYFLVLHELGHAMGLSHPNNNGNDSSYTNNGTVMSYKAGSVANPYNSDAPQTQMIYDIATMQNIYGANTSYNSGNTTITLTTAHKTWTVWDGGGTDTFDASGATGVNARIDLREGLNNVTTVGNSHTWIAVGANIENATGGAGNDLIYGNSLANTLIGGDGADTISGDTGRDTIQGGTGNDSISGGNDNDSISGGDGNDYLDGGIGNDSIAGDSGADSISGSDGNDTIAGGDGADTVYAGNGNDYLDGGLKTDYLFGGSGSDTLIGGNGGDTLNGGEGKDIFRIYSAADSTKGASADFIQDFSHGNDKIDIAPLPFTGIIHGAASGNTLGYAYLGANTFVTSASSSTFGLMLQGHINLTNSDFIF